MFQIRAFFIPLKCMRSAGKTRDSCQWTPLKAPVKTSHPFI